MLWQTLGAIGAVAGVVSALLYLVRVLQDRAKIILKASGGYFTGPSTVVPIQSPYLGLYDVRGKRLFMLQIANVGRRPVKVDGGGMKYRTTGIWRVVFWDWRKETVTTSALITSPHRLPAELGEQDSLWLLAEMDETKRNLREHLKSPHQLGVVFTRDIAGREYHARMPRSLWKELAAAMRGPMAQAQSGADGLATTGPERSTK